MLKVRDFLRGLLHRLHMCPKSKSGYNCKGRKTVDDDTGKISWECGWK